MESVVRLQAAPYAPRRRRGPLEPPGPRSLHSTGLPTSLDSLVGGLGTTTAVGELSGPKMASRFHGRYAAVAPDDLEPGAGHRPGRSRLVAPARLARRRPDG